MFQQKLITPGVIFCLCLLILSCNDHSSKGEEKKIVNNPEQIDDAASNNIEQLAGYALEHGGSIDDTSKLRLPAITYSFYNSGDFRNVWSKKEKWQPLADSFFVFLQEVELYGLFPKDYQVKKLFGIREQLRDSAKMKDAVIWSKADLLLTDASLHVLKDLKYGRLSNDSADVQSDTTKMAKALIALQRSMLAQAGFTSFLSTVEPVNPGYIELKKGIKRFVDSMDRSVYTYVVYPFKKNDAKDSLQFIKSLQKRLYESKCISFTSKLPDSTQLDSSIKRYQKLKGVKPDGKITAGIIKTLNTNDEERFKRIAITLDRYKAFPDSMPRRYIWVNLPGFYLQLWDSDTIALESKVICGKASTPTPQLQSVITDMVTYPTWTVPTSIIAKQYLPKLKNNPNYLSKLGLKLMNEKGEVISASSVNWGKYSKGIPYKVMQSSGDNNALGVMKFNFSNPYAVYLHDTNQRYLFKNSSRAFSHGCVRVQEWEKLAEYLIRNDSMNAKKREELPYSVDSVKTLLAEKKNRRIPVKSPVHLYITYFGCDGKDGKIKFYDDIYGDDKEMREKYFANR